MWTYLVALLFIMHGIGHTLGLAPVFGWSRAENWSADSWLLTPLLGAQASHWIGAALWIVATIGFIAAGFGLLGWFVPQSTWRTLALIAAFVSLAGLALYWNAFPALGNKVGAILVDAGVIIALIWFYAPRGAA